MTKEEFNKKRREYRKRTGNKATRRYEKTVNGYLMRTYRNMKSRVTGVQWKKAHLYEGKSLLPKQDFYDWALESDEFRTLFINWSLSGYDRKLSPSINRIDPEKGYELGNIEWLTHSENSSLGGRRKAIR